MEFAVADNDRYGKLWSHHQYQQLFERDLNHVAHGPCNEQEKREFLETKHVFCFYRKIVSGAEVGPEGDIEVDPSSDIEVDPLSVTETNRKDIFTKGLATRIESMYDRIMYNELANQYNAIAAGVEYPREDNVHIQFGRAHLFPFNVRSDGNCGYHAVVESYNLCYTPPLTIKEVRENVSLNVQYIVNMQRPRTEWEKYLYERIQRFEHPEADSLDMYIKLMGESCQWMDDIQLAVIASLYPFHITVMTGKGTNYFYSPLASSCSHVVTIYHSRQHYWGSTKMIQTGTRLLTYER